LPRGKNNGKHDGLYSWYRHPFAGTYLMRLGGAKLGNRLALSERSQALLSDAATVLLFSVALATTFYEGEHFAGMARVFGVGFAVLCTAKNAINCGDHGGSSRYAAAPRGTN
jgi:hypothetical protein